MIRIISFLVAIICAGLNTATGRTLNIPTVYANPKAASVVAQNGDTVLIESGYYQGAGIVANWMQNNITLKGINGRAHFDATGITISNGKAIWVIGGTNVVVENIEFSNADVTDNNGAGIRYEGIGRLVVRNSYFHNNEMGILTGNRGTEDITLESCEFHDHGKSNNGFSHNIYIGQGAKFTMKNCYSHDAYEGHNVKSRADVNYILYNRIIDHNDHPTDKASSYLIDLPEGGLSYVIGNQLHQSSKSPNSSAISYAKENSNGPLQILYFINNTIVNDRSNGIALNLGGTPSGKIINNIFDNFTTTIQGSFGGTISNNETNPVFVDRINFDYHLKQSSPGINGGKNPESGNGFDLTPNFEYLHPLSSTVRFSDGLLDVGAFEFSTQTSNTISKTSADIEVFNYPNPFQTTTTIQLYTPIDQYITLKVIDINGRIVSELLNNQTLTGSHKINFNARQLKNGIYLLQVETKSGRSLKKMILVK